MKTKILIPFCFLALLMAQKSYAQTSNPFLSKKNISPISLPSSLQGGKIDGNKNSRAHNYNPFTTVASASYRTSAKKIGKGGTVKVVSKETGLPVFLSTREDQTFNKVASGTPETECKNYLKKISKELQYKDIDDFVIQGVSFEDNGSTHFNISQHYKGIKVHNAQVKVHFNKPTSNNVFNGHYHLIKESISINPAISASDALSASIVALQQKTSYRELTAEEKKLIGYTGPEVETVIYPIKTLISSFVLAYHISIHPNLLENWEVFINASNGKLLDTYNNSCHVDGAVAATGQDLSGKVRNFSTLQENATYSLTDVTKPMYVATTQQGTIVTVDAKGTFGKNFKVNDIVSSDNKWNNPTAVSSQFNAGIAYDYYLRMHQRNSIDGKGGDIISVINAVDEDGKALDNAYWSGKAIFYGNGGKFFKPLARALDVSGHELTHGVIQSTANLQYQGEAGAINESMADVFGCMMDTLNWTMGEDIVQSGVFSTGALRSLQDPHNGGSTLNDEGYQPKHVNEKYKGTQDNGGVHINSGIPNYAFYLLATKIGRIKAANIYYRALSLYITQNAQFTDLRLAITQAATDLFKEGSNEVAQVAVAFDAVGISVQPTTIKTTTIKRNPGEEFMLLYNTDKQEQAGLLRLNTATEELVKLTSFAVGNKPSVTDDGSQVVFVGTDHRIYKAKINDLVAGADPDIFHESKIWSNASISKDGRRIAAVTTGEDTSIFVFDIASKKFRQFMLYNPTFTPGVKAPGPVYADAIEWDYKGENLIYDAFNSIPSDNKDSIQYWDINLIKVWDNGSNNFGDGTIFKLITNLEEGESIGNPSFAKTAPYKIAFDYFNESTSEFSVYGYDVENNDLKAILSNNTIGWPSFNKSDSLLAVTTIDPTNNTNIGVIELARDIISPMGTDPYLYVKRAKWGVYYSTGYRELATGITEKASVNNIKLQLYPNPVQDHLTIQTGDILQESGNTLTIFNQLGEIVLEKNVPYTTSEVFNVDVHKLTSGFYTLKVNNDTSNGISKFLKVE